VNEVNSNDFHAKQKNAHKNVRVNCGNKKSLRRNKRRRL